MQESHDQESIEKQKLPGMDDVLEMDHSSAAAGNTETAGEDAAPSLEQQLKEAEIRAAEHHDAWLRAKAETENIRKRAQTDIANAHKYAVDNFSVQLLAVMDSLDAALATENSTLENLRDGVELTRKQLAAVFEKFNIHTIDPQGEKFDPHQHEAMCAVESDLAPNTVIQVMQKGYMLHDRVIRPAMVTVSKAKGT
ncbi:MULTISPECIES: nucleotide exchange factor GrpE [Nitrosomonas]|uniref:nucleotide exchange factor GrpE n=1 Tax=Nitrosomonas TaxID=914 RepID=UPI001937F0F0|nr:MULTISPECIES: nucleotide exchange factor GrpE [Nitrosomonas]MBV6390562.1 Protein GrpE [Nitrosomonas europaea]MEB2331776.1 nucleotide exchange factor GrpE [Nitrosomonas sp.]QOJ09423.1 MAG: nucleotide exchange factor GrpE [Nitrosomonas sp. H1_AOB3]HNR11488.1 nucleotide exchange factor GrpE [Nitrosomonas europaea]HNS57502.1 nucleotide exchange factor GrpE [Nitrosomonas europaea]